jgi:cytosine deaminase
LAGDLQAEADPSGEQPSRPAPLLLHNATLVSGQSADVFIEDGLVAAVVPLSAAPPPAASPPKVPTSTFRAHDLTGYLLLPSAVEAHAHPDKALLASRCTNEAGDLLGAIRAVRALYASVDEEDVRERASRALAIALRHGYTAVRSHVSCEPGLGVRALRGIASVRAQLAGLIDIQVVAHIGMPVTGDRGAPQRALIDEALAEGVDLIGGAPDLDDRPVEAMRLLVGVAAAAGLAVDLHLDETTDPGVFLLEEFASEVLRQGLSGRATASHCVSLGQQPPGRTARVAAMLADAGVSVVTLPQTNLFLQGRGHRTQVPRGLTAVAALREAGVALAGGGDNWRDPFNPLSRIDPFETASLLVAAAHLRPRDAYEAVTTAARQVLGLPPVALVPGSPADLLAVRAATLEEAVAEASEDRWVFKGGNLVARTQVVPILGPRAGSL